MRIIISPAKKMNMDTNSFPCRNLPRFLPRAEELLSLLREKSAAELKSLWKCNDSILQLNVRRLEEMDLYAQLTPALLAYEGIQYRYMSPGVFTESELEYVEEHLRILSGFYGVLRPFDGVRPYRLEMQAKLENRNGKDLYTYWGNSISESVFVETDCVINLASKEYSLCLSNHLPERARFITCVFGERRNGKIQEKGTLCKMARGEMVRYMAENQIRDPEHIRAFDRLGYRYSPADSDQQTYTFMKEENHAENWDESP